MGDYMNKEKDLVVVCDECGSEYLKSRSMMMALCPECSHILYGYENCNHKFKDGRCLFCFWDGSRSKFIKSLIDSDKKV
jgi:predicted RNA-binding Zn-ribbon protein involved in translation (DUF1610 family)